MIDVGIEVEIWKDIPAFMGLYQASALGRIKSLSRRMRRKGNYVHTSQDHILKGIVKTEGYIYVNLYKGGVMYHLPVHALVLEAFVGPRPVGMECRHFPDRNPANNRLDNVCWGTHKANCADKSVHGSDTKGERNGRALLTSEEVLNIRRLRERGLSLALLGRMFDVDYLTIRSAVLKITWKHI